MSMLTEIADAVAAELKHGDFPIAFTPTREWSPITELTQLSTLSVVVIPATRATEDRGRGVKGKTFTVAIVVQKTTNGSKSANDELDDLVESIMDFMDDLDGLTTYSEASVVSVENEEAALVDELVDEQLFVSVILVTLDVEILLEE